MAHGTENSVSPFPPSNRVPHCFAEACREAARAKSRSEAAAGIIRTLLRVSGAERAFLVHSVPARGRSPLEIRATVCQRDDGVDRPSLTLLRRALAADRPMRRADLAGIGSGVDGESFRQLDLIGVLSLPVPLPGPGRAAVVLDSRRHGWDAAGKHVECFLPFADLLALILSSPRDRAERIEAARSGDPDQYALVGRSPGFLALLARARRAALFDFPVLIQGESGAGKEGIARLIHARSPRRDASFVALNCASIPESLMDGELFGARRGAYTGAERDRRGLFRRADGGTLFLDEIGDMPTAMQARLLRVLQEGRVRPLGDSSEIPVDVRVVAATHRDLRAELAAGRFRRDLYHRIAVLCLRIPPLRDRMEDLPLLVEHLGRRLSRRTGLAPPVLTPSALRRLQRYRWPGNVRELEAVLARAQVDFGIRPVPGSGLTFSPGGASGRDPDPGLERQMIERALEESRGRMTAAAKRIGWTRQKLYRRMRVLGLVDGEPDAGESSSDNEGSEPTSSDSSTVQ